MTAVAMSAVRFESAGPPVFGTKPLTSAQRAAFKDIVDANPAAKLSGKWLQERAQEARIGKPAFSGLSKTALLEAAKQYLAEQSAEASVASIDPELLRHTLAAVLRIRCGSEWFKVRGYKYSPFGGNALDVDPHPFPAGEAVEGTDSFVLRPASVNRFILYSILKRAGFNAEADAFAVKQPASHAGYDGDDVSFYDVLQKYGRRTDSYTEYAKIEAFVQLNAHRFRAPIPRPQTAPVRDDPNAVLVYLIRRVFNKDAGLKHYQALAKALGFGAVASFLARPPAAWATLWKNGQNVAVVAGWGRNFIRYNDLQCCEEDKADIEAFAASEPCTPAELDAAFASACGVTVPEYEALRASLAYARELNRYTHAETDETDTLQKKIARAWTGRAIEPKSDAWKFALPRPDAVAYATLDAFDGAASDQAALKRLRDVRTTVALFRGTPVGSDHAVEKELDVIALNALDTWDVITGDCSVQTAFVYTRLADIAADVHGVSIASVCRCLMAVYGHRSASVLANFDAIAESFDALGHDMSKASIDALINDTPPFGTSVCTFFAEADAGDRLAPGHVEDSPEKAVCDAIERMLSTTEPRKPRPYHIAMYAFNVCRRRGELARESGEFSRLLEQRPDRFRKDDAAHVLGARLIWDD